jgi:hypothetical protein
VGIQRRSSWRRQRPVRCLIQWSRALQFRASFNDIEIHVSSGQQITIRVVCVVCLYISPGHCRCSEYFIIWQQNKQVHTRAAASLIVFIHFSARRTACAVSPTVRHSMCKMCEDLFLHLYVLVTRGFSTCSCSCIVFRKMRPRRPLHLWHNFCCFQGPDGSSHP